MPVVWRALLSQGPSESNQQEPNKLRNDPEEGDTSLSQLACLCVLCNCVSTSPELLIQQACFRKPVALEVRETFVMDRKNYKITSILAFSSWLEVGLPSFEKA